MGCGDSAMNKMLERAAWSVCETEFPSLCDELCPTCELVARAVIYTLRKPTNEMLEDAGVMMGYDMIQDLPSDCVDTDHIEWWQGMINSVLAE